MRTIAELTLGREPDAVPRARRLVRSALGDEMPEVAGDAELVVSELVTNAALHGEAPITVRVLVDRVARIEVHDSGRSAPILLRQATDAMTGRGLSMVAAIARFWGVEPAAEGKTVWAELDPDGGPELSQPPEIDLDALLEAWSDDDPATATYTVKLGPVSTELLLAAKSHIDNVVRELMLMREGNASSGAMLPAELAALIDTVTVEFAEARTEIKRQAAAAASRGEVVTELELHLSPSAADAGERYLTALDQADRYARSAHLLTLAPPRIHRVFRQWYVRTIVDQLRAFSRGEEPPAAVPLQVVLTEEVSRLNELAAGSDRLAMMQRVSGELAAAVSKEEMAAIAVDRAIEFVGVEMARVGLVDQGMLRSVAWRSRSGQPDHGTPDIPLDSDLPAAVAVRTGLSQPLRSLAETFSHVPDLAGYYQPGHRGHAVPLIAEGVTLGALSLTFAGGDLTDEDETAFVSSLADVLARALGRVDMIREARRTAGAGDVLDQLPTATLAVDQAGRIALCNAAAAGLLGRDAAQLVGQPLVSLIPPRFRDIHQNAFERFLSSGEGDLIDAPSFTAPALRADGSEMKIELTLTAAAPSSGHDIVAFATLRAPRAVTEEGRASVSGRFLDASLAALAGQRDVLERMVAGDPLPVVLGSLVAMIESVSESDAIGSVLLLDPDGTRLRHGASGWLPQSYTDAIDGLAVGPAAGSCGTAAYTRAEVVVEDIAVDPLWDDYRHLALPLGLRACWSTPIVTGGGDLLGTFAVYYREPKVPPAEDRELVGLLVRTAAVAIGRARADQLREAARRDEQATREELERAHDNLAFVLEATTRVASSLDSDDTLRTLARIAVPALADVCLIDLLDGVAFRRAATAVSEAIPAEVGARLSAFAPDLAGEHPAATALRTGRVVLVEQMDEQFLRRVTKGGEHLRFVEGVGAISCMAIPLAARGRSLGAMTLAMVQEGRRFSQADQSMVEDLGRRVALAIDNTQLYESTRQAQSRLALVARAGVVLTSSLDLATVVAGLGRLIKGEVADACEIHVRRAPEQWWHLAADQGAERLARTDRLPPRVAEAVETRSTVISRSPAGDVFSPSAGVEGDVASTVIPLIAHGEVVGVISLVSPGASEPTRVPAETVDVIAGRAALAIDNALLYEQERTAAEILQRSLLPRHLPSVGGVRSAARYLPAGARNEIGGDWYDLFRLAPERIGIVMGDVMGRGIPAASIMGQLRNGLRMLALQDTDPAEALGLLNRMLGAEPESPLATVAFGVIDIPARTLTLANAGHLPPLVIRRAGSRFLDQKPGLPLGAFPDSDYTTALHRLEPGDGLVLYTDGLIEQRERSLEEGLDALLAAGSDLVGADPDSICDALLDTFRGHGDEDDTAALALLLD